jgi:hypothetical protein
LLTLGGIDTSELPSKTFEAGFVPGSISSAKSSILPAITAALINGRDRPAMPQVPAPLKAVVPRIGTLTDGSLIYDKL